MVTSVVDEPPRVFDITNIAEENDRKFRALRVGFLIIGVADALLGVATLFAWTLPSLVSPVHGPGLRSAADAPTNLAITLLLLISSLSVLWTPLVARGRQARQVRVDSVGIEFRFPSGRLWKREWGDSSLYLQLVEASAGCYTTMNITFPTTRISHESYAAIIESARAHGASVEWVSSLWLRKDLKTVVIRGRPSARSVKTTLATSLVGL